MALTKDQRTIDKGVQTRRMKRIKVSLLPPLCTDCGVNRSDPPSKLCLGCQAYQEHTGRFLSQNMLRKALEDIIKAWETLPGPRRYSPQEIDEWLSYHMSPAINRARQALRTSEEKR